MDKEVSMFVSSIRKLTDRVESANSLWKNFLRGVVYGLGWAIGATVIAAAVAAIVASLYDSIGEMPFFQ